MKLIKTLTYDDFAKIGVSHSCSQDLEEAAKLHTDLTVIIDPDPNTDPLVECPCGLAKWYVPESYFQAPGDLGPLITLTTELYKQHLALIEQDGCDHDVGICYCADYAVLVSLHKILTDYGVKLPPLPCHEPPDSLIPPKEEM